MASRIGTTILYLLAIAGVAYLTGSGKMLGSNMVTTGVAGLATFIFVLAIYRVWRK